MRKRLSLGDLIDVYTSLNNSWKFRDVTKDVKRSEWNAYMLEHYPDLKPCPFCGFTPDFTAQVKSRSLFACKGAEIECWTCDLKFKPAYTNEDVISRWNSELKR